MIFINLVRQTLLTQCHRRGMTGFRIALCSSLLVTASAVSPSCAGQSPIRIQYELKDSTLTLGEPAILVFSIRNDSDRAMSIDLGGDKTQFLAFSVTTPDGQVIRGGPPLPEGLHTLGTMTIAARGIYKQELLLNQWFEFKSPGRYFLEAKLNAPGSPLSEAPSAQGRWMRLEIKPRDINRLTKVCAELAARTEEARSVTDAQDPTLALSYVRDPVAVPYLARVLSGHALSYQLAVAGLERIGNDAAVETLLSELNDKYGDIGDLARRALARMEDRISNPHLKEAVTRALATKADS